MGRSEGVAAVKNEVVVVEVEEVKAEFKFKFNMLYSICHNGYSHSIKSENT